MDTNAYKKSLGLWSRPQRLGEIKAATTALRNDTATTRHQQLDLMTLFAIPEGELTAQALATHADDLTKVYNKAKGQPAAAALKELLDLLIANECFTNPTFWTRTSARQAELRQAQVVGASRDLASTEAPLKVISRSRALKILANLGVEEEAFPAAAAELKKLGVTVFDDLDLASLRPRPALGVLWKTASTFTDFRTPVDVLASGEAAPASVAVVDSLRADGTPITLKQVQERHQQTLRRKDTPANAAARSLLDALARLVNDEELQRAVLGLVVNDARAALADGVPAIRMVQGLCEKGITELDARRIVATLVSDGAPAPQQPDLTEVRPALASGQIASAQRLLNAVQVTEKNKTEHAELRAKIDNAVLRKQESLSAFTAAMQAGRYDEAERHIVEAMHVDTEDPQLTELQASIPPAAPQPSVRVLQQGAQVTWTARPGLTYAVMRSTQPGTLIGATTLAQQLEDGSYTDTDVPVGEKVTYAVIASRTGGASSQPGTTLVQVLPSPTNLHARPGTDFVDLSWSSNGAVHSFEVTCLDETGRTSVHQVPGATTFRVPHLRVGSVYRLKVAARYLTSSGMATSVSVETTASPREPAHPITDLKLVAERDTMLHFTPCAGFSTEIWSDNGNGADLPLGAFLAASDLRARGLRPSLTLPASRVATPTQVPAGTLPTIGRLYALVATDDGLLVGAPVTVADVPQVSNARVLEFGDQLRLTWEWPDRLENVEVSWCFQDMPRSQLVSRHQYMAHGSHSLPSPHQTSNINVTSVAQRDGKTWKSAPVEVAWTPREVLTATYTVDIKKSFGGKQKAVVDVHVTAGQLGDVLVGLFMSRGRFLPQDAREGSLVGEMRVDWTAGTSSTHTFDLGKQKDPFWVRLFVKSDEPLQLAYSNITQLKG